MPVPVIATAAAGVVIPFIKKHPWMVVLLALIVAMPLFLISAAAYSGAQRITNLGGGGVECTEEYKTSVLDIFKDDDGELGKTTMLADCPPPAPAAGPVVPGAGGDVVFSPTGWTKPVALNVGIYSPYGPRKSVCGAHGCSSSFHKGVDISPGCKIPIHAVQDGVVTEAKNSVKTEKGGGGYGNYLHVDHGGGVSSFYGHIYPNSMTVKVGDTVKSGDVIALIGDTGTSFGCHVHFEIRLNNVQTDPAAWMLTNTGINLNQKG
jgi:hypothetical protein